MNGKFIVLAAFALALAAVPVSASHLPDTGGNPVDVYSCERVSNGISIMHTASSTPTTLLSSCRDGGDAHGELRQYTMSCTTRSQYYVSWKPCGTVQPSYVLNTFGVGINRSNLFEANYGYLRAGKQYWAKMAGDIPVSWTSFHLNANSVSGLPAGYTYAFAWTEKEATSGGSAYNSGAAFDENLAKVLVKNAQFTPDSNPTFVVTDYYRGKMVTALVFARNNDGVSRVPNMPTEVDDVIAVHFYVPNKPAVIVPVTPTPTASTYLTSLVAVDKDTNYEIGRNQVSYYDYSTFSIGSKHSVPANVNTLTFVLTPAGTKSNLSYAFIWGDRTDDGYNYNSQYVTSLAAKVNFNSSNQVNLPINEYYRGKWVLMLGFVRDNDGVSKVPGMPVEVDDVMPLYVYIPAKSSVEPKPEIKPEIVPVAPTPVEPGCSDVKGGDVTFIVCDEYAVDHYLSGAKIKVIEHDEEMAQVDLVGLNAPEATLGKGETQIFTLAGNSAKYLKVTYLGMGQWGRALIKVQSNTSKNTPNECVNQTGGDGQYIVCAGKSLHNTGTNIKMLVTSVSKTSVFIKATGATNTYYNIKKGATKSIVQKARGSTKFIKVTYKGLQGKKAILEIEEKGTDKIVAKPAVAQPTITQPTSRQILTNYPRTASISWTAVEGAESYEVDVECDICRYPAWTNVYKYTSASNTFTTEPLAGDNTFRVRVRAVYSNGTNSQYSDYVYFSYKTSTSSITATYGVGVNNYPDTNGTKDSVNLPNAFVNMYTVVLQGKQYVVTGLERKNTGTGFNPWASFTILPNQMVYFEGFKTEAGAQQGYESIKVKGFIPMAPYKNFGIGPDTLCVTDFANPYQLFNNSQKDACSTSLSTPYQD